ncbi:MAG: hypothetical protein LBL72_00655 [Candidatus Accumulibacter sp.]|jgi:hypothetical protein|nr:hypothetical protein [Accumulibacter sp.]
MDIVIRLSLVAPGCLAVWGGLFLLGLKNAVLRAFLAVVLGPFLLLAADVINIGYLDPFWEIAYYFCIPFAAADVIFFEVLTSILDSLIERKKRKDVL